MKFNMKSNEIITDFKLLPCYIKSKLFTTFCADAYGCQLWNFESREVHHFYVAWRQVVRKLWRLPYITHCTQLTTHSPSKYHWRKEVLNLFGHVWIVTIAFVKSISQLATKLPRSVFGHNYRYFSYKYSIMSHQWYESYNSVHHSIRPNSLQRFLWSTCTNCHWNCSAYWILMYDIGIFVIICTYLFILNVVLYYYDFVKIIIIE